MAEPLVERVEQALGGFGNHGAGRENRLGAGGFERIVILRRYDAADHKHNVGPAVARKFGLQFGDQCQMGAGERRYAEDMDVVLDGSPRGLVRRCE